MLDTNSKALWDAMTVEATKHNERNDCTVRALTASTGLAYDVCHEQFRKQGRKNRKGVHFFREGPIAATALGYTLRRLQPNEYRAKTMITAERDPQLSSGSYCVLVRGHVAALVEGKVIDWSQGRRHKIQAVYAVTKNDNVPTPIPTAPKRTLPKGSATWQSFRKYKKQDNYNLFD